MKRLFVIVSACVIVFLFVVHNVKSLFPQQQDHTLLTGVFLADTPSSEQLVQFSREFGKTPYFILLFLDWEQNIPKSLLQDIFSEGSTPVITWEPWDTQKKQKTLCEDIIKGNFDQYIDDFAKEIGSLKKTVFLRFAHEMNGNWYPWSSAFIGPSNYKSMFRHVKDRFDALHIHNVKWIFSINCENVPSNNDYTLSYPGNSYVDYIGVDGYNWGYTRSYSEWKSFQELFLPIYRHITTRYCKDILITEFGSTSVGGNKATWLFDAFSEMRKMKRVRGFILFDMNKEADWSILPTSPSGKILREVLKDAQCIGGVRTDP